MSTRTTKIQFKEFAASMCLWIKHKSTDPTDRLNSSLNVQTTNKKTDEEEGAEQGVGDLSISYFLVFLVFVFLALFVFYQK